MELPGMAELTTLIVIVALAPASLALENDVIECGWDKSGTQKGSVTKVGATLTIRCNKDAEVKPSDDLTEVYKDEDCKVPEALTTACPDAEATVSADGTAKVVKISVKKLPTSQKTFYVKCEKDDKSCVAEVTVTGPPTAGEGGVGAGGASGGAGGGTGADSGQQPGGTTSVQTCEQVNTSITVRIPEKGSSAQFACEEKFTLYPSAADKIFSADCKKQETLKNMTRSKAQAGESQTIFTLTADKNPPKKKLCYLCARAGVSESKPGTAKDYCMIYVESSVRTPFGLGSTLALMLPCVLAALHFT